MIEQEQFIKDNPLTEIEAATIYTFIKNTRSYWYPSGPEEDEAWGCDDLGDVMDMLVLYYE